MKHVIRYEKPNPDEVKATLEIETTIAQWRETLRALRRYHPDSPLAKLVGELVANFDKQYRA